MVSVFHARVNAVASFLVVALLEQSAVADPLGQLSQPIIYGVDDRVEVYEVADAPLKRRAELSTVSFMYRRTVAYQADGSVSIQAFPYDEIYDLCVDEPFLGQPAAAWCTGVLIDDDLVLTAGHCLGEKPAQVEASCLSLVIAFGYHFKDSEQLESMGGDDIFRCRRVVAWSQNSQDLDAADYAIIQLDRSAIPSHEPTAIELEPVQEGQQVAVVTHGAGLPTKVDQGAVIVDTRSFGEYFRADTDTFEGASGSPVFDVESRLIGVHTRGNPDWEYGAQCTSAVRADTGSEDHQVVASPLAELCSLQWPSEALCGIAPLCGDGVCSTDERSDTCAEDCAPQRCGDGLCERDEPLNCPADCDAFSAVPEQWLCAPEFYQDANGCDCDCGAWDPDCDDPDELVLNCEQGSVCLASGQCELPSTPSRVQSQDGWGCSAAAGGSLPLGTSGGRSRHGLAVTFGLFLLLINRRRRFAVSH